MKLNVSKRKAEKKSESQQLRRAGQIPAVIYSKGGEGEPVAIEAAAFQQCLRAIPKGRLATTRFVLVDSNGKGRQAIVKDIQYHVTTYNILHLDFEELHEEVAVNVNVPIEYKGESVSPGVKLGGVVRQVLRSVKVKCLPQHIPDAFLIDISRMQMRESKRLSDIEFLETKPCAPLDEVALAIVKR